MTHKRRSNILLFFCCTVIGYVVAKGCGDELLAFPSEVDPPHQVLIHGEARVDMSDKMYNTKLSCCILNGGSMISTLDRDHTNCTALRLLNCTHISSVAAAKLSKLATTTPIDR